MFVKMDREFHYDTKSKNHMRVDFRSRLVSACIIASLSFDINKDGIGNY